MQSRPHPTNLKATETTTTSLKVSWEASSDSDGTITKYIIEHKKEGSSDEWQTQEVGATTLTATITGLKESTKYQVRIKAIDNREVASAYSTIQIIETPSPKRGLVSRVKKTGQTNSYTKYDDGYYANLGLGIAHSYTRDDAKEIVTDKVTGLQWQDDERVKTETMIWGEAKTSCSNLTLGGHSDWRLPTVQELKSIVDKWRSYPAIDPTFQNVTAINYWSSTTSVHTSNSAWYVTFIYGSVGNSDKLYSGYVRCVR